ncbi:hypothetical protein JW859_10715 [bacterium]|nr:hypothetical protein [bacterium]
MLLIIRGLIAIILLCLLTGCAGNWGRTSVDPQAADNRFPAPSELRAASDLLESASFKYGEDYRQDWPSSGVFTSDTSQSLFLSNSGQNPIARYCYVGFSLAAPAGDFDNTLRLVKTKDFEEGEFWVGLADFAADTWYWQLLEDYQVAVDPARHLRDGEAYVILSYTGNGVQEIQSARLGALAPPFIASVTPPIGTTGGTVTFSARLLKGDIFADQPYYATGWHWEFNGAASPVSSSAATPQVTLGPTGAYECSVTASNAAGTVDFDFTVFVAAASPYTPATLYAIPLATTVTVGEPVRVRVITGQFAPNEPLCSLSGAGVTVPVGAHYVEGSFNVGTSGGAAYSTDGFWDQMEPPVSEFLEVPDEWFTPIEMDGTGLVLLPFSIAPIQGHDTTVSGVLFNFQLTFDSPGLYELGFIEEYAGERTFFTEESGTKNYWYDISNDHAGFANSVLVTE